MIGIKGKPLIDHERTVRIGIVDWRNFRRYASLESSFSTATSDADRAIQVAQKVWWTKPFIEKCRADGAIGQLETTIFEREANVERE